MRRIARFSVVALCFTLTACGVPTDDAPRAISRQEVPFEPVAPASPPSSAVAPLGGDVEALVFFIGPRGLVGAPRRLRTAATTNRLLEMLLQGPTAAEQAAGLRTAINQETRVLGLRVQGGVANIDLSRAFAGTNGQEQIRALAQLLYTVTGTGTVMRVRFRLNGRSVEVPRGDGTLSSGPLSRQDYTALAPV